MSALSPDQIVETLTRYFHPPLAPSFPSQLYAYSSDNHVKYRVMARLEHPSRPSALRIMRQRLGRSRQSTTPSSAGVAHLAPMTRPSQVMDSTIEAHNDEQVTSRCARLNGPNGVWPNPSFVSLAFPVGFGSEPRR